MKDLIDKYGFLLESVVLIHKLIHFLNPKYFHKAWIQPTLYSTKWDRSFALQNENEIRCSIYMSNSVSISTLQNTWHSFTNCKPPKPKCLNFAYYLFLFLFDFHLQYYSSFIYHNSWWRETDFIFSPKHLLVLKWLIVAQRIVFFSLVCFLMMANHYSYLLSMIRLTMANRLLNLMRNSILDYVHCQMYSFWGVDFSNHLLWIHPILYRY